LAAQLDLQAPAAHANGTHEVLVPGVQPPLPSQLEAPVAVSPAQLAGAHAFDAPWRNAVHLLVSDAPSHASAAHTSAPPSAHAGRAPCGSPSTGAHLPSKPGTSQAWHWPPHAASQHTPSTQLPEPHSLASEQLAPLLFVQIPLLVGLPQELPAPQSVTPQQTPSVQNRPALHTDAPEHATPSPARTVQLPALQKYPGAQSPSAAQPVLHVVAPHA
jgi:hypothetical protein